MNSQRKSTFPRNLLSILPAICLLVLSSAIVEAQNLKADYQFQGNMNSSVAGAPAMTGLPGSAFSYPSDTVDGYARPSLRFQFNSGVAVNTNGLIPNNAYTIVMLFRFDETSGFRRVVSFDNGTSDNGAYIHNGRLENETTSNPVFFPNTYIQVVIVREASGRVRAYRDGDLRVDVPNDGGAFAITAANTLRFFQDDSVEPNEASAGNVARIQLYDAPMTTTQVRLLDRVPNTGGGDQPILFTTFRHGLGIAEIFTMNADGSNQKRLTFNEVSDEGPKWSPDKTKIVYYRRENSSSVWQIWIMNADGSGQTRLTNTTTHDLRPTWKPDGTKILFSRCNSSTGICDLYTMNPNGSEQTLIPNGINTSGDEDHASFSPDGTKIIFVCAPNTLVNFNICTANADGTNRQQLTNTVSPVTYFSPVYSPNGAKIAFERWSNSADGGTADIYVMDSNGSNLINLTNNTAIYDANPKWSADGTKILFQSQRESVYTEVYTMNSTNGSMVQRLTINSIADGSWDWYRPPTVSRRAPFDFDGDGKADVSVFRPTDGTWYLLRSLAGFAAAQFGISTDKVVPADFDGDGKTDIAVYRDGVWYWLNSSNGAFNAVQFGLAGDIPQPADFTGDGRAELVVYRGGIWYVLNLANGQFSAVQFGLGTDKPVVGDYDGDGRADYAVYRPSDGVWYLLRSAQGFGAVHFGVAADKPVQADYDGDGKTDQAVYRDGAWYLNRSAAGFAAAQFGLATDAPAPADYDGDGKADIAVYRNGVWYLQQTTSGFAAIQFGVTNDKPIPNAFVPQN